MKKQFVILAAAAAALLLLAGCDKQQLKGADESNGAVSVPVWFEPFGGASTKVDVDGTTGIGTWTVGDQIAIYVEGTGANFYQIKPVEAIEDAPNNNTGHVMVSLAENQNRNYYAVYPASARVDDHFAEDDFHIKYPAEYDYSRLTAAQMETFSPVPMVAVNSPVTNLNDPSQPAPELNFYHVGGVLRITVPGVPQRAYALRFTFPETFKVNGRFQVSNGGTTNASLTDAGPIEEPDPNDPTQVITLPRNVITVKLPKLNSAVQDLVLNIPLPSGNYSTSAREFRVDVRTEKIAYMKSDGIVNFSEILRAQGKKQIVPTVETLGTMAEMYLSRGYLVRSNGTTVAPADMSFDDAIRLCWYKNQSGTSNINVFAKRLYIGYTELGKIMTGNPGYDGSTSFEDAELTIDGTKYRVPTMEDWKKIIDGERPGSTINDQQQIRWAKVGVSLSTLGLSDPANGSWAIGVLLFPDGGVFDEPSIKYYQNGNTSYITYAAYRKLTDGPNACAFLVYSGFLNNMWRYTGAWNSEYLWSSTPVPDDDTVVYNLYNENATATHLKSEFMPVRLVRVEE